jgi:hypothetical protein
VRVRATVSESEVRVVMRPCVKFQLRRELLCYALQKNKN